MHLIAPLDKHFSILYCILKEHILEDADYKVTEILVILAFFVLSSAVTSLYLLMGP